MNQRAKEAIEISRLMDQHGITYTIMKFYEDDELDDDIDIVVTPEKFDQAVRLLETQGYEDDRKLRRGHLAHLREPLKILFKAKERKYGAHLHKTFSWNGVEYLNPKIVHQRHKKNTHEFYIPTKEDQFLIIIAHSIFENNFVKKIELQEYNRLQNQKLDKKYILRSAREYNWDHVIPFFTEQHHYELYPMKTILTLSVKKLLKDIFSLKIRYLHREIVSYFIVAYFWCYLLEKRKRRAISSLS